MSMTFEEMMQALIHPHPHRIMDIICAVVVYNSSRLLPPANELFANEERHEWYCYEICSACRARIHFKNVRNIYGMLWICINCYPNVVKEINKLETIRKYNNLATLYGKFGE